MDTTRREQTLEEIAEKNRQERVRTKEQGDAMEVLVAHPAWQVFIALVTANANNHLEAALQPGKTDFHKGTLFGLKLAMTLPHAKINEAKGLRSDDEIGE